MKRNFLRLRHAKAHDTGALKNPFFTRAVPSLWFRIALFAGSIIGILGLSIALTHLPFLQLNAVVVEGVTTLDRVAIENVVRTTIAERSLPFCATTNPYIVRTSRIERAIARSFSVRTVRVKRQGASLHVFIEENVTTIALKTKEKTVLLDLDGSYVRDATSEESRAIDVRIGASSQAPEESLVPLQNEMPIVITTQNESVSELSEQTAQAIMSIAQAIGTVGFHPTSYIMDGLNAPDVRVSTEAPYVILFDLFARPIDSQIRALHAIVTQESFVAPNEYLDLRFGAYVYMK
jgi:hypothetical protein